jgi:hypothetical protein
MDLHLKGDGINVPEFAKRWKVSTRTIHRDLQAFRDLGQKIGIWDPGFSVPDRRVFWHYIGTRPLFVRTLDFFKSGKQHAD